MTNYRRKRTLPKDKTPKYSVNEQIGGVELRVLDGEGQMMGIFTRSQVLEMAQEKEMDVIEINPKANPPVVKLMDYNKFKYQVAKSQASKQKKADEVKTIRMSVRISIHDMQVQARKIDQFLSKGMKVRVQVQMRGREKQHPEVAEETMNTLLGIITEEYVFETEPKLTGDSDFATIKPKKQQ
jgi:translation initiation factor IF-3